MAHARRKSHHRSRTSRCTDGVCARLNTTAVAATTTQKRRDDVPFMWTTPLRSGCAVRPRNSGGWCSGDGYGCRRVACYAERDSRVLWRRTRGGRDYSKNNNENIIIIFIVIVIIFFLFFFLLLHAESWAAELYCAARRTRGDKNYKKKKKNETYIIIIKITTND